MGAAPSLDPAHDPALRKLMNMLGAQARPLISETMREAGLVEIITPTDRYRFACALMKRGGIYEAMGRAIKIQAILHGAAET